MARRFAFILELVAADGTMPTPRMAEAVVAAGLASPGYGTSSLRRDYRKALATFVSKETVTKARAVQHLRITRLMRARWQDAIGGDDTAIGSIVKLMEREARLLGLDAPNRTALEISMHVQELSEASVAATAYAMQRAEVPEEMQQRVVDGIRQYLHQQGGGGTVIELEPVSG
jgi:hypothetical protein